MQLTIDRVVFLRMAENRGLNLRATPEGVRTSRRLSSLHARPLPQGRPEIQFWIISLPERERRIGRSDQITPKLLVDDRIFIQILHSLYFAYGSPYHFGVLPVEILGTIYERFLGKVIKLTAVTMQRLKTSLKYVRQEASITRQLILSTI